jgi:hypothetical protein
MVAVQTFAAKQEMTVAHQMAVSTRMLVRLAVKGDILALLGGTVALKDTAIQQVANVAVRDIIANLATNVYSLMGLKNAAQMTSVPRTLVRG